MNRGYVYFVEKNAYGAWVIYGELGVRHYYGYTKTEAINMYKQDCQRKIITNQKW